MPYMVHHRSSYKVKKLINTKVMPKWQSYMQPNNILLKCPYMPYMVHHRS